MFMGCLKLAHIDFNEPVLRCVWNPQKRQKQGVNWYDYGARMYDPVLGRFFTLDLLAETYNHQTPYSYAVNNPIRFIDWMGMGPGDPPINPLIPYGDGDSTPLNSSMYPPSTSWTSSSGNTETTYSSNSRGSSAEKTKTVETVLSKDDWESSENGLNNGNCNTAATKMVSNSGATTAGKSTEILVANHDANGVVTTANGNVSEAINVIDKAFDNKESTLVGVDYKSVQTHNKASDGGDGMTDHFVSTSTRTTTYSNGQASSKSYGFFDSRTQIPDRGTHTSNTFSVGSNNLITGGYYNNSKTYTVTTVRRNK
ncbi:MAG: hypothetical protein K9H49_20030 [Bacteroidales bacterium]|nr:hypothetical protein [Bacteroidales bacterium]